MKDEFYFLAFLVLMFLLFLSATVYGPSTVHAQAGMPIILDVQSSLAGCASLYSQISGYATIQNGMAICALNLNGVLGLAVASPGVNGGAFTPISGGGGGSGVPPAGTVIPANETCPKGTGTIGTGWGAKGCTLTVQ